MPDWAFLTNHALVLCHLAKKPQTTALEVSLLIGLSERAVRKIIADLAAVRYIRKTKEGRRVRYSISSDLVLRHRTHSEVAIADFLAALGWKLS
jgi:DNA-binding IclR family transcriptional regulator